MRRIVSSLATALLVAALPSCTTLETPTTPPTGLAQVLGEWSYSHVGPPTIWLQGLPEPTSAIDEKMRGTQIAVTRDGTASLVSPAGDARLLKFTAGAESETTLELKGMDLQLKDDFTWTYDKTKKAIVMPLDLTLPGNQKGSVPAYFTRSST